MDYPLGAELVLEGDVLVVYTSVDWVIEGIPCIGLSSRFRLSVALSTTALWVRDRPLHVPVEAREDR